MKKLLAVIMMSALAVGAISLPAWGAEGTKAKPADDARAADRRKEGPRHKARRHVIRGEITKLGEGSFVMKTRKGPLTVKFGEGTRFKGGEQSNLKVGAKVGVVPQGCAKKPEVSTNKAPAGADLNSRKGARARARFCIGAVSANTTPRTLTARAILFPRTPTAR